MKQKSALLNVCVPFSIRELISRTCEALEYRQYLPYELAVRYRCLMKQKQLGINPFQINSQPVLVSALITVRSWIDSKESMICQREVKLISLLSLPWRFIVRVLLCC